MNDDLKSPIIIKYQNLYKDDPQSRVFAPLAEAYRKFGMVEEAIDILKKGIRNHPNFTLGYLGLAQCYYDQNQYQMAYETLKNLVDDNRENLKLLKLYAQTCDELKKSGEALETYKYLLYINPRDEEAAKKVLEYEDLNIGQDIIKDEVTGEANVEQSEKFQVDSLDDDLDKSIDEWVKVDLESRKTEQQSEDLDATTGWEMQQVSNVLPSEISEKSDHDETDLNKNEVNIAQESSHSVSHTLVNMYLEQGQRDKAIEVLEKIIELNPEDTSSIDKLTEINTSSSATNHEQQPMEENQTNYSQIHLLEKFLDAVRHRKMEKASL